MNTFRKLLYMVRVQRTVIHEYIYMFPVLKLMGSAPELRSACSVCAPPAQF